MKAIILRRVVNSSVWIISGILIIIIRTSIIRGGSILVWEVIGGGMMLYGAARLVWALIKAPPTSSMTP